MSKEFVVAMVTLSLLLTGFALKKFLAHPALQPKNPEEKYSKDFLQHIGKLADIIFPSAAIITSLFMFFDKAFVKSFIILPVGAALIVFFTYLLYMTHKEW